MAVYQRSMLWGGAVSAMLWCPALANDNDEKCALFANTAETIMQSRQNGVSLAALLAVVERQEDPSIKAAGRELVLQAFEVPRFNSDEVKQQQVENYRDKVHLACLRGMK